MALKKQQATKLVKPDASASSRKEKMLVDAVKALAAQDPAHSSTAGRRPRLSYDGLVKSLAQEYGVAVGEAPAAKANPYRLNTAETEKALRRAGIHTRAGKLAALFK